MDDLGMTWLDDFLASPALEEALTKEAALAPPGCSDHPAHPAAVGWALPDLFLPSLGDLTNGPSSSSDFAPLASASEGFERSASPASSSDAAVAPPPPPRRRGRGRVAAAGKAGAGATPTKKRGRPASAAAPPKKRVAAPRRRRSSVTSSAPAAPTTHVSALPPAALAAIFAHLPSTERRHTLPRVCKAWRAVLAGSGTTAWSHVAVDVEEEAARPRGAVGRGALVAAGAAAPPAPAWCPSATLRASALHAWLTPRAPALRSLSLTGLPPALARAAGPRHDLTPDSLAAVLSLVSPWLEELLLDRAAGLLQGRTWTAIACLRRLRVLGVRGIRETLPGDEELGALAALAPTLKELVMEVDTEHDGGGGAASPSPSVVGAPVDTAVAAAAGLGPACKWGLRGFPAGVLHLGNLTHLTLSSHLGINALPAEIGARLGGLEQLGVDGCALSALPPSLGLLTALTSLDLEGNRGLGGLAGPAPPPPAAAGPAPAGASADGDAFPPALAGLRSLRHANLNACGLVTLPPVVGAWRALAALDAEANEFGAAPSPDAALAPLAPLAHSLVTLNIAQCGLAALPAGIASLAALRSLDASANAIDEAGLPAGLAAMPSLRALGLAGNALKSLPRAALANPSLRALYAEDNARLQIAAPLDWVVDDLASLRVFRLGGASASTAWSPASLAHLARLAARLGAAGRADVLRVSYPGAEA